MLTSWLFRMLWNNNQTIEFSMINLFRRMLTHYCHSYLLVEACTVKEDDNDNECTFCILDSTVRYTPLLESGYYSAWASSHICIRG